MTDSDPYQPPTDNSLLHQQPTVLSLSYKLLLAASFGVFLLHVGTIIWRHFFATGVMARYVPPHFLGNTLLTFVVFVAIALIGVVRVLNARS